MTDTLTAIDNVNTRLRVLTNGVVQVRDTPYDVDFFKQWIEVTFDATHNASMFFVVDNNDEKYAFIETTLKEMHVLSMRFSYEEILDPYLIWDYSVGNANYPYNNVDAHPDVHPVGVEVVNTIREILPR